MKSYLDLVTIFADDVSSTTKFYTELLGFEIVEPFSAPDGSFTWLKSEKRGTSIAVQDVAKRADKPTQADIPADSGGVMLGFTVDDADSAYQDWQSLGIEMRTEVVDMGPGARGFGAKDPAGNYVQIFHVPPQVREKQKALGLG